ncbi:HAMP domain-containing sensor histidine kinase [Geobacter sp. DSM 9736]|uniref:HAMP domain-containing sensor histidine kinase n=1 Tax=Geobacter sp. DSM 9736 TaxID=1277350 RepID=UPI000B507CDE|nr:HAMP domain-containing sensor histidine kinase [Geobacter sp. DSM 9736]SNB47893.1 HAMP domain-containing protein [Geobacter sp. DSM 9736]
MIFKSVTTRVIVISISLLVFGISSFTFLNLTRERTQLIKSARESTELLLQTIERSIYGSMRIGNTEDVQRILEMVGQNHKLQGVRIFHPHGVVLKSSNPDEVGKPVDDRDYNLFINNKKDGIFTVAGRGDVIKMLKPIYNDVACYTCHGHKTKVIGVLNIEYSLAETRKRMVEATKLFIVSTIAIISFLSIMISFVMLKFVRTPLRLMAENMARVEKGDLSVRMKHEAPDEIGRLISSFDSMVGRLDTARKELEQLHFQQMERADRLASVGEMAAGIAHEIKNPLTGIASAISIIKDDFSPEDGRTEILNEVLEQVKRLDKTVNDLLFFGKPTPPEPAYTNINSVLKKTLLFAAQHRGGKSVEKRLDLQDELPPVYVDPKQIQQVFLNLMLNALQAMQGKGVLTVRTRLTDEEGARWICVSIADTGPGIPAPILDKIFIPFFTTKAQGTGLGLAICHKLIKQQGGEISVVSEDDVGTEFIVKLPVAVDPTLLAEGRISEVHYEGA